MNRLAMSLWALLLSACEMFVTRPGHVGEACKAGACNQGLACINGVCVQPQGRADVAPSGLAYSENPAVYTVAVTITPNQPNNTGGAATTYSVAPPLPAGLNLDLATGIITGTPNVAAAAAGYVVTATNSAGSTTVIVTITVRNSAPASLTYSVNPAVYMRGTDITPNLPSNAGGVVSSYSISPALPAGLSLDASTGIITGTPMATAATADYVVTAANSAGSTTVALSITVNDLPPGSLSYQANPATYTKGVAIAPNVPASSGGTPISYSVLPTLPDGLVLNTTTGVITGTPTGIVPATAFVVTATTTGGTASVNVTITVNDVPPKDLAYGQINAVYTKGATIAPNAPTVSGGAVVSWSVSPSLPPGISLDATTGVISGIPGAVASTQGYAITAANSGGSSSATVTITVNDQPPTNLEYNPNPVVYHKGLQVAPNQPTNGGGAAVSYAVTPSLPLGLAFAVSTGVVSGTPTALTSMATYTVTATCACQTPTNWKPRTPAGGSPAAPS